MSDKFVFRVMRLDEMEAVTKILAEGFYPFENICVAANVSKNPKAMAELDAMVVECVKDGVSVVAVKSDTGIIVGACINKIQSLNEEFFENFANRCHEIESKAVIQFMIDCDNAVNVFEKYRGTKLMEFMFLMVAPAYRKCGIGKGLIDQSLRTLNELSPMRVGLTAGCALFTSNISQKIGQALEFDELYHFSYDSLTMNGKKLRDILPASQKGATLVGKMAAA